MHSPLDDYPVHQIAEVMRHVGTSDRRTDDAADIDDDWRHGMWQGDEVTQRLRWDLTDPDVRAGNFGLVENKARAVEHRSCGNHHGWGMFEFACIGAHDRSGFVGWEKMGLFPATPSAND